MTANFSGRKHIKWPYYYCLRCDERFRAEPVHEAFLTFLKSLTIKPEIKKAYLMIIEDVFQDREKGRLKGIQRVKTEINKLSTTISSVEDKFFQNLIDFSTYEKAKERYQGEKMNLEEKKKLLSILFPEKLVFENGAYRAHPENIFFSIMLTQLRSYEEGKIKKLIFLPAFPVWLPDVDFRPRRTGEPARLEN